jgi:hypothetical protein
MKLKNEKNATLLMCAGCGMTFDADTDTNILEMHQENNENCNGFFKIELIDKRALARLIRS